MNRITIVLASLALAGCTAGISNLARVQPGMTPDEVTKIMGPRDSFTTVERNGDQYTLFQYTNRWCNPNQDASRCDMRVLFKNQKVIGADVADIRRPQNADGGLGAAILGAQLLKRSQSPY